jgi:peptide chain release factor 2
VHRLVRLSPFDSAHRRHTSFALVEVYPQVETDEDIALQPSDLKIDTFRSAGAGGQNVQKNETAIRITHLPTGIVVTCQNERSQTQNRENALRVLKARLLDLQREKQEEELAKLKGDHVKAEWGSQIRSYVLHPYQMVKDHRTGHETGNTTAVLDGDLEDFMQAYLRSGLADGRRA